MRKIKLFFLPLMLLLCLAAGTQVAAVTIYNDNFDGQPGTF